MFYFGVKMVSLDFRPENELTDPKNPLIIFLATF